MKQCCFCHKNSENYRYIYSFADRDGYICDNCYNHHYEDDNLTWFVNRNRRTVIVNRKDADKYCKPCSVCGVKYEHGVIKRGLCYSCHKPSMMRSFSYTPKLNFYHNEGENTDEYIGVELEVDGYDNKRVEVVSELYKTEKDFVYCKSDGSISLGVEIVSHPATYQYHCNTSHWKNIFDILKKNKMDVLDNCGLHFHVDRNAFKREGIATLDCFVYNNRKIIEQHGGRELNHFCVADYKNRSEWGKSLEDHYRAVELAHNDTVELRFCKSTNDYDVFMDRLKFIKQLVDFSNHHRVSQILTKDNNKLWKDYFGE